jgi:hypothetical protein
LGTSSPSQFSLSRSLPLSLVGLEAKPFFRHRRLPFSHHRRLNQKLHRHGFASASRCACGQGTGRFPFFLLFSSCLSFFFPPCVEDCCIEEEEEEEESVLTK